MTITTNLGNFHGFKNIEIFMRLENISEIEIQNIKLLSMPLGKQGKYNYNEILEILNRED